MKNKITLLLLFLIPSFLVFKAVFLGGELSFGDAPYFYPENLRELFNKPFIWDIRYINFGGNQGSTLWLYLPTFVLGVLHNYFGFNSELLLRIIFIIPSITLGFSGIWKLGGYFIKNNFGKFLAAFLYIFNTYFILLVDGGQIGVALAYGLFPWVIFTLFNYQNKQTLANFLFVLITFFLLTNIDVRVAFIALFLLIILVILKVQNISISKGLAEITLVLAIVVLLDSFWIYPLVKNVNALELAAISSTELNFVSLLDSLLLYQPHFPNNDFGKLTIPPFYFTFLLPILLSGLFLVKKERKFFLTLCFIFLLFVFLTKGKSFPLGEIYSFIDYVPLLGIVFRDSSKFFIPLFLIAGLLLGLSYEITSRKIGLRNSIFLFTAFYVFLVTLISPAVFGELSGGLNNDVDKESFNQIYRKISSEPGFYRILWFDERPTLGYISWDKPALSANTLYLKRPFADMIEGSYDLNGFLNSPLLKDWLQISGVKYIFLPENERKKVLTKKQLQERKFFLSFFNDLGFKKIDWNTSFPIYEVENNLPHIYSVEKINLISGGGEIYSNLGNREISIVNNPAIFIDDVKFNINLLDHFSKNENTQLVIQGNKDDLIFSLLRDRMIDLSKFQNNWAKKGTNNYLETKAELLERGIRNYDYDFGKALSYSSVKNEEIKVNKVLDETQTYILAIRYLTATDSSGIRLNFNSEEKNLKSDNSTSFTWKYFELKPAKKLDIVIKNLGGFVAVNTLVIIPMNDLEEEIKMVERMLNKKEVSFMSESSDYSRLRLNNGISKIDYKLISPVEYKVRIPDDQNWIIFTDSFDKKWTLENSKCKLSSIPIYSFVNGFYIDDSCKTDFSEWRLYHASQKDILVGIFLSFFFSTTLIIGVICFKLYKDGIYKKNN